MDTAPIQNRTSEIIHTIRSRDVDIAFLQEVSHESTADERSPLDMIRRLGGDDELGGYTIVEDTERVQNYPQYFVMMMYKKNLFKGTVQRKMEKFPESRMGRSWIEIMGELRESRGKIAFITSHLESLSQDVSSTERKSQFQQTLQRMRQNLENNVVTIFGGDTNLREKEISAKDVLKTVVAEEKYTASLENSSGNDKRRKTTKTSKPAQKVSDAWVLAGGPPSQKFTWDTMMNDNLDMNAVEFRPRSRYDRLFSLGPPNRRPKVTSFELIGKERLSCGKFPSDHYGVLVEYEIPNEPTTEAE